MTILVLIAAAAMQAASALPGEATVRQAVERLDMTSFPNSLGPRRGGGRRTPRQFGNHRFTWSGRSLMATEGDGSWERTFTSLRSPRGRIRLCFTDHAQNGGSYYSVRAIELSPTRNGLYRARTITHRDCPAEER